MVIDDYVEGPAGILINPNVIPRNTQTSRKKINKPIKKNPDRELRKQLGKIANDNGIRETAPDFIDAVMSVSKAQQEDLSKNKQFIRAFKNGEIEVPRSSKGNVDTGGVMSSFNKYRGENPTALSYLDKKYYAEEMTEKAEQRRIKSREIKKNQADFAHSNGLDKKKTNQYFEALKINPDLEKDTGFVKYMNNYTGNNGEDYASGYIGQKELKANNNELKQQLRANQEARRQQTGTSLREQLAYTDNPNNMYSTETVNGSTRAVTNPVDRKKTHEKYNDVFYAKDTPNHNQKLANVANRRNADGTLAYSTDSQTFKDIEKALNLDDRTVMPTKEDLLHEEKFTNRLNKLREQKQISRNYEIPKESSILSRAEQVKARQANRAAKEGIEEAAENAIEKGVKGNADDVAKKLTKTKVGRIAAAVGVGALVVSNMNKNKGQQTNGQLYGQQTPYSY